MGLLGGIATVATGNPIIGFALNHWRGVLLILCIVTIVGSAYYYIWNLHHQIDTLTESNRELTVNLEFCEEARTALKLGIAQQNKEIEDWKKRGDAAVAKVDAAKQSADAVGRVYADQISKLLKQPKPVGCDKSIEYLRNRSDLTWGKK